MNRLYNDFYPFHNLFLFYSYYIPIAPLSFLSSQSCPYKSLAPLAHLLLREQEDPFGTTSPWDIQFLQDKAPPLSLRSNQAVPVEEGDPVAGGRVRDSPCSNCQGTPMKTKLHMCYKCVGGLGPVSAWSLVSGSVSVSPHEPRLIDSVGLLAVSLTLIACSFLSHIILSDSLSSA